MNLWKIIWAACFLVPLAAPAATLPPGFDLAKYQQLTATAAEKGKLLETGQGFDFMVLTHLNPSDPKQPHKADYFSAVGNKDTSGVFHVYEVSMESEDWRKRPDGDWDIEEWNWTAYTDGTLVTVNHSIIVEDDSGSVKGDQTIRTGEPSDPAELAHWGAKVAEWESFAPDTIR